MPKNITDGVEISSDEENSDKENSEKKIIVKINVFFRRAVLRMSFLRDQF